MGILDAKALLRKLIGGASGGGRDSQPTSSRCPALSMARKTRSFPLGISFFFILFVFFLPTKSPAQEVPIPSPPVGTDPAGGIAAQDSTDRIPVAFLGFSSGEIGSSGLDILTGLVQRELSLSPLHLLVAREDMSALLKEQALSLSGVIDEASALRVGKMLGARKLLSGTIGMLGSLYIITLRLIDAETGATEEVVVQEFVGPMEDLRGPVRIAAQRILKIPGIDLKQGEYISIEADPPGVSVYVNGLYEGSAPLVLLVPRAGTYAVKLAAEGYKPWTQNVKVGEASTYFVKARLLKQDKPVDERIKALQDGRAGLLTFLTAYSAITADTLLFSLGYAPTPEHARLYIGLPLVTAPSVFFAALKLTEGVVMNGGRSFFITSSMLWGSSWGVAASLAFLTDPAMSPENAWRLSAGLSALGGVLYGTISTLMTVGTEPFPASRAWLFNLGSALGAFLGLGIPYVLNVNNSVAIYVGMLSGSLAGSGIALWLTRDFVEGRSIGNLAAGSLLDFSMGKAVAGIPLPRAASSSGRLDWEIDLIRARF